jgi:hypothetical protein
MIRFRPPGTEWLKMPQGLMGSHGSCGDRWKEFGGIDATDISAFFDPYQTGVLNELDRLSAQNVQRNLLPGLKAGFVGSGGLGSQRYAGALGQSLADVELGLAGQRAGLMSKGYQEPAGVEEIVVKGRGEQGKPIPGTQVYTPPGLPPTMGVPFMPPNPKILTSKEYYAIAAKDPKISAAEAVKTAQEMERNRYIENERGVIDRRTGLRFEVTGSDLVERELTNPKTGAVGTYKIPQNIAIRLDHNKLVGNQEAVDYYTRMVFGENMPAPAKGSGPIGQAPIPAGTAGPKSEQEKGVLKISREKTAEEEAKINVDKEAALGANDDSARIMFQNAQILQDLAAKSPQAFGLLQTPTIAAAIGTAIDEGISIGNTRISLGGFYDAILKVSGVKQEDIANLEMAASALAELELKYTQLYLKGQGQVTEGERLIVRRIAGTPKNSPEFIIQKAKLIQMRSQYDIDVIDTFRDIKENDPNMTWSQFERSKTFRDMRNDFNKNVSGAFGLKPAVPSSKRGQSSSDTLSVDSMREALRNRGQ